MRHRPLLAPPPVSLSTRASTALRLRTFFRVAAEAGVDGIDLDLSGPVGRVTPAAVAGLVDASGVPINSVWVSRVLPGPWARRRSDEAARLAAAVARAAPAPTLIVDARPRGGAEFSRSALAEIAGTVRDWAGDGVRVAIALRPHHLAGGRAHLAHVAILRRLIEEWDLDLALDLLGPVDPQWEVEAAVSRLLPRLAVVRLGPVPVPAPASRRGRLAARALLAALDAGFGGTLAVAPSLPAWQIGWAPALARAAAAAGDHVRLRYAAIYEQPAFDSSPDPRPRYH